MNQFQTDDLLSRIQQISGTFQNSSYSYQQLQWKYGTIIFINNYQHQSFIFHVTKTSGYHNLLLTTAPFQNSTQIPSLNLESKQEIKSLNSVEKINDFLIQNNATRSSHLVIKGGGLLMDLGGFAASIYMRGIKNITLIPTTFLGMVDASVGGKTAVNHSNAKNLIGSIRNANNIIISLDYLSTQLQREFLSGLAQSIKMAITFDKSFFQFLQTLNFKTLRNKQNHPLLLKVIKKSLAIKIRVVEADLTEKNQRKWLNFGHTIGHAIQLDQNNRLLHGECVSIGMVKALEISIARGIISRNNFNILERLKKLLKKNNLPTQIPPQIDFQKMIQRMLKDKKAQKPYQQLINFVLIEQIGRRCQETTKVPRSYLESFFGNSVQLSYPHQGSINPINDKFPFPSSKSISLRYLYIGCLMIYQEQKKKKNKEIPKINLQNFLSSQDTEKMIYSLQELGFVFEINTGKRQLSIVGYSQRHEGQLDVGNSGITARFILPLCFMIKGHWKVNCQKRMQERPNVQIFQLCNQHFQGQILYLNKQYSFPVQIFSTGVSALGKPLVVDGKQSSQFISSAMINWSFLQPQTSIFFKPSSTSQKDSEIVSQSYIHLTSKCLQTFGIETKLNKKLRTIRLNSKKIRFTEVIHIENDLSTYSYPYLLYELHGIQNWPIDPSRYMQGDVLFYQYVQAIKSLANSGQRFARLDFNNCTDTFMTFMVFCYSDHITNSSIQRVVIENISNQRVKESNRVDLTIKNLKKIGLQVQEYQNKLQIIIKPIEPHLFMSLDTIIFETHEDHRLAMSFGILATLLSRKFSQTKFFVDSKKAVQKTFPEFWQYLEQSGFSLNYVSLQQQNCRKQEIRPKIAQNSSNLALDQNILKNSLLIIGNRGSGKTIIGQNIASQFNLGFIDTDDLITKQIKQTLKYQSIEKMVEVCGWNQFRDLQSQILQKVLASLRYSTKIPFVISTGGGILERQLNRMAFLRQSANIFYLERPFSQLKALASASRPPLDEFQRISKQRQSEYQKIANQIITFSHWLSFKQQCDFAIDSIKKYLGPSKKIEQGYIMCLGTQMLELEASLTQQQIESINTFQIRVDKLLNYQLNFRKIRQLISNWRIKYPSKKLILTLRSSKQLGQFKEESIQHYQQTIEQISRIPCDFLDFEVTKSPAFFYNPNKFIHSYHGDQEHAIKKLLIKQKGFKKFCYIKPSDQISKSAVNLYEKYKSKLQNGICIDLSNPLTRLKTKYQMVIPEKSFKHMTPTGIMTISQMKTLSKIFKLH